ncbi:MAG: cation:proton antiporter, partial [Deltaproteobacteria bacterium]
MRKIISVVLLSIVGAGIYLSVSQIPFGAPKTKVGGHYV